MICWIDLYGGDLPLLLWNCYFSDQLFNVLRHRIKTIYTVKFLMTFNDKLCGQDHAK